MMRRFHLITDFPVGEDQVAIHQRAGQTASQTDLVNIPKLMSHYYSIRPNVDAAEQRVTFGTSGHRGTAFQGVLTKTIFGRLPKPLSIIANR